MYKVGDRIIVKAKPELIKTFNYYQAGLPNWTQSRAYMIMHDRSMFAMCGQQGVVYEVIGHYGEEVKIKFDDDSLSDIWTWHTDWLVRLKLDNKAVGYV